MADLLQITHEPHGILRLTLNDPARRNVLSEAMLDHLWDAIQLASDDASVRAVIIAANGPAFCAGHDLKELTAGRANDDKGKAYFTKIMTRCSSVMHAILQTPKPVIAEVTATATAAGCQLVASCDLAFASPSAKFSTPGVHIGLFCSTPMVFQNQIRIVWNHLALFFVLSKLKSLAKLSIRELRTRFIIFYQ